MGITGTMRLRNDRPRQPQGQSDLRWSACRRHARPDLVLARTAAACALSIAGASAQAQVWQIEPSVTAEVTFTDNAGLAASRDKQSDFVLQLHYTPKGKAAEDRTRIGLVLAKTPPAHRAYVANIADPRFVIPPGDPNYAAKATATLASEVTLLNAGPHMHLRGKAMDLRAVYPTGESEILFHVPRYDFNWQQLYQFESAKVAPRGTRMEVDAIYDNSANNPFNPDPDAQITYGQRTVDEMSSAWLSWYYMSDEDYKQEVEARRTRRAVVTTSSN